MFTKRPDKEPSAFDLGRPVPSVSVGTSTASAQVPRGAVRSIPSLVGAELVIVGNLVSRGEVQIDGEVQGDVHAAQVMIGESSRIMGGIVADDVVVRGTVAGTIRGKRVVLQASSRVEGDIFHNQLAIEQGAYFEGKSRHVEDPTAGVPSEDTAG